MSAQLEDEPIRRRASWPTRSVVLENGKRTSIAIEDEFWDVLLEIAAARRITVSSLCRELHRPDVNLASRLRTYVLRHLLAIRRESSIHAGFNGQLPSGPMPRYLHEAAHRLVDATSVPEAERMLRETIQALGFEHVAYMLRGEDTPLILTSYPEAWQKHYRAERYLQVDPTIVGAKKRLLPFEWTELRPTDPRAMRLLFDAAASGLRNGVTAPLHGLGAARGFLSVTVPMPSAEFGRFWEHRKHQLLFLAAAVHEVMQQLLDQSAPPTLFRLEEEQADCLSWIAAGLPRVELGPRLGRTEREVDQILERACRRLGVYNPDHASARALRLKLIRP